MTQLDDALLTAYHYARRKAPWDEDAPGEFVLYVEPNLRRLLDRWEDRGIPVSHAIAKMLKFQARSFFARHIEVSRRKMIADIVESSPGSSSDHEPTDSPQMTVAPRGAERRALYLAALSCPELPDAHLIEIARVAGVNAREALSIRAALEVDAECASTLRVRRDKAYSRMLIAQWSLTTEVDSTRRAELTARELRARATWTSARRRLAGCKAHPTHAEIGKATLTPKGTVDSALFSLRRSRVVA